MEETVVHKKKFKIRPGDIFAIGLPTFLFALMCLIPFILLLASSFTDSEYLDEVGVVLFPVGFTLNAYKAVFIVPEMIFRAYGVSIVVTVFGTLLNMILSIMIAYPLSRADFRYRNIISFILFFTMVFGAGLIPTYMVYDKLGLIDTIFVLIVPQTVMVGYVLMLRVFFVAVPKELIESAELDGAGQFRCLFQICTPLISPGIATVTFYTMLFYWNDANSALYYTFDLNLTPIARFMARISEYITQVRYAQQSGQSQISFELPEMSMVFATAVVTCAPMLFVFTAFQKYFVRGLTAGGVKG